MTGRRCRLALLLALALAPRFAAADSTGLRLLFVANAAPFSATGTGGGPEGYVVALCERVAAMVRHGVRPSWQAAALADGLDRLAGGESDLLCGPVTDTVTREEHVEFSSPVAIGGIGALLRPGAPSWLLRLLRVGDASPVPPRELLMALGWPRRIAVLRSGTAAEWLGTVLARTHADVVTVPVADYDEAAHRLIDGDVGAWVGEWGVLAERVKSDARLADMTLTPRPIAGEPLAIAVRPGTTLRREVQAALSSILRGPELEALTERWFGAAGRAQVALIRSVTPQAEPLP